MSRKREEINEIDLLRYVNHELTERERLKVNEWINLSEANRKIADDYFYLSLAVSSLHAIKRSAPQEALSKVNKRINRKRTHKFIRRLQQAAAILLLPLLGLTAYLLIHPREEIPVFYVETRMTPGMIGSTILPDGTKVWLNSSSYLKHPNIFEGDTREVELDGEAYFEVTADATKPFVVRTEKSAVKVLGTEFNIDAYSSHSFVTTTLVEGSVEFNYTSENDNANTLLLTPNEQVLYDKRTNQAMKNETYVPKDVAWRQGQIVLRDTPLAEILWILSKRFNVEFTIKDPAFYKQSFTGVFTNQQIERVLEHFKRSSGIRYRIDHSVNDEGEITLSQVELY